MCRRFLKWSQIAVVTAVLLGTAAAQAGVVIIDGKVQNGLLVSADPVTDMPPDLSNLTPEEQQLYLFVTLILNGHDAAEALNNGETDGEWAETSGTPLVYVEDDAAGCNSAPVTELAAGLSFLLLMARRRRR